MTQEQVIAHIRALVNVEGSQTALAAKLGISKQYLNNVLQGEREIGDVILDPLRLKRVVTYVKKQSTDL